MCHAAFLDLKNFMSMHHEIPHVQTEACHPVGLVDFDAGTAGLDNAEIPPDYGTDVGVQFALVYPGTFEPYPNRPRLEAVGTTDGTTGLWSVCGAHLHDCDHNGTVGRMFLRPPRSASEGAWDRAPSLLITYLGAGTPEAGGVLNDIDGANTSDANAERFTIRAFDASQRELTRQEFPHGTEAGSVARPGAHNYDAHGWTFVVPAPVEALIKYLRVDFTGRKPNPSMGLDNLKTFPLCAGNSEAARQPPVAAGEGMGPLMANVLMKTVMMVGGLAVVAMLVGYYLVLVSVCMRMQPAPSHPDEVCPAVPEKFSSIKLVPSVAPPPVGHRAHLPSPPWNRHRSGLDAVRLFNTGFHKAQKDKFPGARDFGRRQPTSICSDMSVAHLVLRQRTEIVVGTRCMTDPLPRHLTEILVPTL
eukprot:CAMPEP_0174288368 /NCGR_PEP_ID=MMETSP0809-20121228/20295_1 /TAXON_ID=73025 ORGANISM="Eutreptiella gymnastica-like, Strain CCMP1594" /NCGR_SAMPLE_ID=MMETSP0809 /ASSEMBLY_ACC=CAM_ASM_000658 /LENGTH=415 /DNA_ID=CAMNT_0015385493 /DNA_START=82 /DNA_END=1329 /DNA_ORIENTATION=+